LNIVRAVVPAAVVVPRYAAAIATLGNSLTTTDHSCDVVPIVNL
jgi:hypothetical protein